MGNNNKNSREYLQGQLNGGRHSLLILMIFTVVNVVMMMVDANSYFVCSLSVPYYLCAFGMAFDFEAGGSVFFTTALVITAVILVVYLVCWLQSKKRPGWLYAAFGLFVVDTVALVLLSLSLDMLADNILDLVIHAWVVWELFQGARCGVKLGKLPPEEPVNETAFADSGVVTGADLLNQTPSSSNYTTDLEN